jgi:hypothetical protein
LDRRHPAVIYDHNPYRPWHINRFVLEGHSYRILERIHFDFRGRAAIDISSDRLTLIERAVVVELDRRLRFIHFHWPVYDFNFRRSDSDYHFF